MIRVLITTVTLFGFAGIGLSCKQDPSQVEQRLLGKDEAEVIALLGHPRTFCVIKYSIPPYLSQKEMQEFENTVEAQELVYPDFVVVLNAKDRVLKVAPLSEFQRRLMGK
jgi:hypothetical protein